jgi:hypothetical protein
LTSVFRLVILVDTTFEVLPCPLSALLLILGFCSPTFAQRPGGGGPPPPPPAPDSVRGSVAAGIGAGKIDIEAEWNATASNNFIEVEVYKQVNGNWVFDHSFPIGPTAQGVGKATTTLTGCTTNAIYTATLRLHRHGVTLHTANNLNSVICP